MIGFELEATGSHNFKFKSSAWTEGDIWIKNAFKVVPKNPLKSAQVGMVDAIEDQFKKLGQIMLWNYVFNFGMDLHLTMKGDFNFMYQFKANKPADQIAREFLKLLDEQKEAMRDQVTIHLANCFKNFQLHVVTENTNDLKLVVDIDL